MADQQDVLQHHCAFTPLLGRSCDRCKAVPLEGETLTFLHAQDPNQSGRHVCNRCYDHYMSKPDTVTRTIRRPGLTEVDPQQKELVRKAIARGQRGEATDPVQRLGPQAPPASHLHSQERGLMPPPIGFPLSNMLNSATPAPFGSFSGFPGQGDKPMLLFDQRRNITPLASSSAAYYATGPRYTSSSMMPGYTPNHLHHAADQKRRAQQAYAAHGGFVVPVEVRVSTMPMGRTTSKLFADVLEVMDDVPVHIGAQDLKQMAHNAILRPWNAHTDHYPLAIDDVILRDEKWALIQPKTPDVDAIAHKCFVAAKKPGGAPQFRSKKLVVHLHIPNKVFDRFEKAREEALEQASVQFDQLLASSSHDTEDSPAPPSKGNTKGRARRSVQAESATSKTSSSQFQSVAKEDPLFLAPNQSDPSLDRSEFEYEGFSSKRRASSRTPSTPPPKRICLLPTSPESPQLSREQLEKVLSKQTHGNQLQLKALFKTKVFQAVIYPMKKFTKIADLQPTTNDWRTFCDDPRTATLTLDTDPKNQMTGAFKMAILGESNPALFDDPSNFDVCVKQTFYATKGLKIAGSSGPTPTYNIAHDAQYQPSLLICTKAKLLSMEVRCLGWGHVLLSMTYTFMRRFIRNNNNIDPPFDIPQMRFVRAALASSQEAGERRELFLVEERITESEGKFRKFINNRAAIPTAFKTKADMERAEFLAFTQHIQYWSTFKMVFVSDYQGGNTLLTDPQILSSPKFADAGKHIFADGNVLNFPRCFVVNKSRVKVGKNAIAPLFKQGGLIRF
ncbi:hypothetical protein B0H17DRAFT_1148314 [Mycena rosella]|uniref:Alpha-type protein kinase domain-containing protein n=1 Tax=Mycena rosella TaxID=1033263 RepID=A0AAD7CD50_MYCRO|nr:hypothetical protein B0H17DRAFT_1148314 [Mycena rosella]